MIKEKRVLLIIASVFLAALVLLLFFRETVASIFVVPLLYLFWIGDLIIKSIDQRAIWWFLVGLVGFILLRGLVRRRRTGDIASKLINRQRQSRRVNFWAGQIRRMMSGTYPDAYSKFELRRLIFSVMGYRTGLNRWEIERGLQTGEFDLPPEILSSLQIDHAGDVPERVSLLYRVIRRLMVLLSMGPETYSDRVTQDLEKTIQFLEDQLEINREH